MVGLFHRKKKAGEGDLEAGARRQSRGRIGSVYVPGVEDLGEYPALDRYISVYRDERRRSATEEDTTGKSRKKRWWQFGGVDAEETAPVKQGIPESWLETDMTTGIASSEVDIRRKRAGWNELTAEKENMFVKFLGFFTGPILYVMEVAALLAVGLGDWVDFGVILGILFLNAFVGFYQEKQAADVVASLKGDIAMRCTVVRDSNEQEIPARELVPGDILIVQEGGTVAADARLLCDYTRPEDFEVYKRLRAEDKLDRSEESDEAEGDEDQDQEHEHSQNTEVKGGDTNGKERDGDYQPQELGYRSRPLVAIDQSAITGESLAVEKYLGDMVYYTTGCKRGKAYSIVTHTARESFVGRTADLVQGAKDQGHFKAVMNNIGTSLLVLVMFWILAAWIGGFFHHIRIANPGSQNLLHYALVLLIIGVPVGLPVVTTTTLAVGAAYLAKQKAIVQKLTAIESLAGVDILCSDKTGTLTANKLSIRDPFVSEGQDVNWMMAVAALASSHNLKTLDPIDKVTILTLKRYPQAREILQQGWVTESFTPFDPVSKRITTVCRLGSDRFTCAKGAPRAILRLANCSEADGNLYREKAQEFARRGFRSLGVAYKKNDGDWILLGLLSMFDPPREDTAQTIIEAGHLGVPVKMLTGDAIAIAKETCKMLSLGTKVYNSERLIHGGLAGSVQHDFVERADGFAEVYPEHKYTVVEMLQQRGHLTAMTGDGVNDAPSLKKADCGIAVEGASEAAQAAADIVFLAPGLSTIVLAIKTARQIFQRMKAYIQYRIALCLHLEIYLTLSMIIINETIRVELIVFLALFADLATVAVAYDNAHWEPRPVEWQLPKIWVVSVILGILLAIGTWVIRGSMFLPSGGIVQNFGSVQEILFLEVALTENWLIFVTRGGKTWPSWQLVGAIFGVDVIATIFTLFGWLSGNGEVTTPRDHFNQSSNGWVDIVTVVIIWLYSFGVTVIIAIAYYLLNKISWLDNLGRKNRSKKDTAIENIIGHLQKLAVEHEMDEKTGKSRYLLVEKAGDEEDDI
ncbi:Plasma membrane ATPase [Fusarium keratoplasticum]|uniref:Plasma membrane ATPase n=1 Tax=Fusarium keratoplasticum TaxID=1328300 RepID=A0ACC0R4W0_9HYPO|nr:Plasma membrane ATPase [Fusarium keratoplasticum]KAI8674782.1 Plasma membrane ATPase [Fusarium keratoplasticum]